MIGKCIAQLNKQPWVCAVHKWVDKWVKERKLFLTVTSTSKWRKCYSASRKNLMCLSKGTTFKCKLPEKTTGLVTDLFMWPYWVRLLHLCVQHIALSSAPTSISVILNMCVQSKVFDLACPLKVHDQVSLWEMIPSSGNKFYDKKSENFPKHQWTMKLAML